MSRALPSLHQPEMTRDSHRERRETIPCYSSYKEFIEKNVEEWPQYRWLQIFFNHGGGSSGDTRTTVFDSVGESLLETAFSITDPSRFRNFLDSRPSNVRSRIIILAYKETWSLDRTFVDLLASRLGLNPDDLQRHLQHGHQVMESVPSHLDQILRKLVRDDYFSGSSYAPCLPSEQVGQSKFLQFNSDWGDRNTVFFTDSLQENSSTVLILLRQRDFDFTPRTVDRLGYNNKPLPPIYNSDEHTYNKVVASVRKMSATDISVCDTSPVLYSYHVFRPWLLEQFDNTCLSCASDHLDRLNVEDIEAELSFLQLQGEFLYTLQSLMQKQHFIDSGPCSSLRTPTIAARMQGLVDDLDMLCRKWDMATAERRRRVNKILTEAQIQEAEQSKSTAKSVASLTRIATIYIPLNFTASFFGMNMAEFGNGRGRLWIFANTALILTGITAIPFAFQLIDWIQGRPAMRESPWVITLRMTYYFPLQGFWLALFCVFHSMEMMHRVCEDGLYSNKLKLKVKGPMRYLTDKHFFASFWRSRLKKVFEVTDDPDWGKRSFVPRFWMKLSSSNQLLPTISDPTAPRFDSGGRTSE